MMNKCYYKNSPIHFILDARTANIMVNATEMAKIFNKRTDVFLKTDATKEYIEVLKTLPKDEKLWPLFPPFGGNNDENRLKNVQLFDLFPPNGVNNFDGEVELLQDNDIKYTSKRGGTMMHHLLAIEFAAWLDPSFKLFINIFIDYLLFGHYKRHWEASAKQKDAMDMQLKLQNQMLLKGATADQFANYMELGKTIQKAKNEKRRAIEKQQSVIGKFDFFSPTEN